jgi:hypothetical protein
MRELVLAFLAWIAAETGLAIPAPPPVVLVSEGKMLELAHGNSEVRGMYVRDGATIYLRDDWNAADLRSRASLLHELVHHVQFANKVPSRCAAERERLAYELTFSGCEQGVADPTRCWIPTPSRSSFFCLPRGVAQPRHSERNECAPRHR